MKGEGKANKTEKKTKTFIVFVENGGGVQIENT